MTTEQTEPAGPDPEDRVELPVMLGDREIYVRRPTAEQLLAWQRVVTRLSDAPIDASWTGTEILGAMERMLRIVNSLMVNKADVVWMDDRFLDGTLDFAKVTPFITAVVDAFKDHADAQLAEHGTRPEKRAAKKAAPKKATRKAPVR